MEKISKGLLTAVIAASFVSGGVAGAIFGPISKTLLEERGFGRENEGNETLEREVRRSAPEEGSVISVVQKVSPAVVSIIVYKEQRALYNRSGPFFFDFFADPLLLTPPSGDGELRAVGGGSGFIVSSDGLVVTNRHVVDDKNAQYQVVLSDGREFTGTVAAEDVLLDFALLKIDADNLPAADFGDSSGIRIGQTVLAIGNALSEFENTVTRGIISGVNRRVVAGNGSGSEVIEEAIQTDAAINPGNSGGPLVDLAGKVIGINTAVSEAGQLIGFAIPINAVRPLIASYQETGRIVRPWLGVRYTMLTPALAKQQELQVPEGAYIIPDSDGQSAIVPQSPADRAGLRAGDVITRVGETVLNRAKTLSHAIAEHKPGETVELTVFRDGASSTVPVLLEERKQDS